MLLTESSQWPLKVASLCLISLCLHQSLSLSPPIDPWSVFHLPLNSQTETINRSNTPISLKLVPTEDSMDLMNQPLIQQGNKYEVFINFNIDEDTFASRLYSCLKEAGISVLKGDISNEVLQSIIEGCKISIVIFSEKYASSRRCLVKLTKLMEFRRARDKVVLPIFHGVDPSEVRNLESSFGEAFRELIQTISPAEHQVSWWKTALSEVGGNYGIFVPSLETNSESEHIQNIVKRVRQILVWKGPFARDGLVGVSSKVQKVITKLINYHSKDLLSIGIWGMGGIGKTTIAKAIFDHIQYEFENTCFLSNVKEGTSWERHWHKKVLVVLEGVSLFEELDALRRHRECFGKGSRIIITTRDFSLLKAFQVDLVYRVKPLSDHESLELFSREAFKQASPQREFIELCRRMVAYTEGLPLALKVVGSIMYGLSMMEWESAWMQLSTLLPCDIYNTLKLSFDSLDDKNRQIFLNIALFHIGEDKDDVIRKLQGHGYNARIGIKVLEDRSLVTIDNKKLRMHTLLQLMGRRIIRQSSQNELLNRGQRYEVFLSFSGDDTRTTFTSHLYTALFDAGITIFKDDIELHRGNDIDPELEQAIRSSKIAIIIFSKQYAASKWCLKELSTIMEFRDSNDLVVLPVFYDVDPSEIRNQTSTVGEAFEHLKQRISPPEDQVSRWKKALYKAGCIAGIVVLGSRDESENVKAAVKNVCDILDKKYLFVADHPVGVDARVQEVITMLQNHQSEDVVMVGLWGMGGTGKTTIAKAIYNKIGCEFDRRCYLPKIRKVWHQGKGKENLQNQLLSEICNTTTTKINSIDSGKTILSDRLGHKKALVLLDDVDKLAQLEALVGCREWFKPGSTIIITTRNKHLLLAKDCLVYMMRNLDEQESLELFSWHAFKQVTPREDFTELSRDMVAYARGLPLALKALGSYLSYREVDYWKSLLERLKKFPHDKIQKKLERSFGGLPGLEKEIFLDIACFFIGMDRNDVTQILDGCKLSAVDGIETLVERSLVTIGEENKLGMHDLLRDMGREIIRKQSEKELGKRSRLWFHEDGCDVLSEQMGTEAIEGLSLKLSQSERKNFQTKAFTMLKRLRLLCLHNVQLRGDYEHISRDQLRWLCWHGFPKAQIPRKFYQQQLIAIDLKYSKLNQLWEEPQLLENLKILNLSHSPYLVYTPDFSKLPNLEKLILKDCKRLSKIHRSIGLLDQLLLLDLENCIGLRSLRRSIYRLKCLKTLLLSGCVMIERLEEDVEQMESLTTLIAPTTKHVPFSLVRLKSILYLSVGGYEGFSHHVIPSLFWYWRSPTNNPLLPIPTYAGMPSSILWDMLNSICGPSSIPSSKRPSSIPSSKPKRQNLLLEDDELEIPDSLCATNCMDILRLENFLGHVLIQFGKNAQAFHILSERVSQGLNLIEYIDDCILPDNYPYWLTFKGEGAKVEFQVPPINGHDHLKGMAIFCIYTPLADLGNMTCESFINCLTIRNYTKKTTLVYMKDKLISLEEAEKKKIISNLESDDQVKVEAVVGNGFTVKKTIVHLIYKESFDVQMKLSTSEAIDLVGTKRKREEEKPHQSIRPRKAMEI